MAPVAPTPVTFSIRRSPPELIVPAKPTPRELKPLSDIDDQGSLRYYIPLIHIYQGNPKMGNKNPANMIREALAKVLVFYYPFAGRLKEGPARKLMVDCSGEGVLFIEAEADVTLKQLFGPEIRPPIPCRDELLRYLPGFDNYLNSPLFVFQMIRLLCGGFIIVVYFNHALCDGFGYLQFMTALIEITNGASTPTIIPVWQRELFCARDPPRVTRTHREYDEVAPEDGAIDMSPDGLVNRSFFFGPTQISAISRFIPTRLKRCSTIDVLIAFLWRCRTIALQPDPLDDMRMIIVANARLKCGHLIPVGYYGNGVCFPTAISKARDLCDKPFEHTLELVMKAKTGFDEEYIKSVVDLMVIKERPNLLAVRYFLLSDLTRIRFTELDFGWGNAVYAAPDFHVGSFCSHYINHNGESGIMVPIWLPHVAMKRFIKELDNMLTPDNSKNVIPGKVTAHSKI